MAAHRCLKLSLAQALFVWLVVGFTAKLQADDFAFLQTERAAFEARIELIDQARQEIDIAYYAIDSGSVAFSVLDRLRQAALRGVRVRLLLDGLMGRLPKEVESLLLQAGVEIRLYHPPATGRPWWLNRRIHYKLFIVDRQTMIVGSRNLEDSHFGLAEDNFVDLDAMLTGEVCKRAANHFSELWSGRGVERVHECERAVTPAKLASAQRQLQSAQTRLADRVDLSHLHGWMCTCVDSYVEDIGFTCLVHDRGVGKHAREFQTQVISIIDSAKASLWIESPYPVLTQPVKAALERAVKRGVAVTLQTNSLGSIDRTAPYAAYQNDKREYQRMGVQLVEYPGADTLHTKVILVDDVNVLLGSYNMDVRSDRLNLEFGVWIEDPRVAVLVKQSLQSRKQTAELLDTGKTWPQVIHGDASVLKRSQMRWRQLWTPLVRNSL